MPFKKTGSDRYVSPSGRHYNGSQVRLWYAHGGKFPGEKGPGEMSKSEGARTASYAQGGAVLGRTRDFMKIPDQFTDGRLPPKDKGSADDPPQEYGKSGKTGKLSKPTGSKKLK